MRAGCQVAATGPSRHAFRPGFYEGPTERSTGRPAATRRKHIAVGAGPRETIALVAPAPKGRLPVLLSFQGATCRFATPFSAPRARRAVHRRHFACGGRQDPLPTPYRPGGEAIPVRKPAAGNEC